MLKQGADLRQVQPVGVLAEDDAVGVSHGNAGDFVNPPGHLHVLAHHPLPGQRHRDFPRGEDGVAHVHGDGHSLAVFLVDAAGLYAAEGFDAQLLLVGDAVVKDVLCHAADAVAAHFALAAVQVEHAHFGIGHLRGADENHPVAPNALVPVGEADSQSRRVLHLLLKAVDVDVVVAAAVHFGKAQIAHSVPLSYFSG